MQNCNPQAVLNIILMSTGCIECVFLWVSLSKTYPQVVLDIICLVGNSLSSESWQVHTVSWNSFMTWFWCILLGCCNTIKNVFIKLSGVCCSTRWLTFHVINVCMFYMLVRVLKCVSHDPLSLLCWFWFWWNYVRRCFLINKVNEKGEIGPLSMCKTIDGVVSAYRDSKDMCSYDSRLNVAFFTIYLWHVRSIRAKIRSARCFSSCKSIISCSWSTHGSSKSTSNFDEESTE